MQKSEFIVTRMDCAAEENLVRLKLDGVRSVRALEFDLPRRRLTVIHEGRPDSIERAIDQLNLNARLLSTEPTEDAGEAGGAVQRNLLWTVLLINFAFFVIEVAFGFLSGSMGLVADSLDMLADAIVYGLSLIAVGAALARKQAIAKASGYFQMTLAVFGILEVVRRFSGLDTPPD